MLFWHIISSATQENWNYPVRALFGSVHEVCKNIHSLLTTHILYSCNLPYYLSKLSKIKISYPNRQVNNRNYQVCYLIFTLLQMEALNMKLKQNESHQTADLESKIAERKRRQQIALRQEYENKRMQELKEAQELLKPKKTENSSSLKLTVPVVGGIVVSSEAEEALSKKHTETLSQLRQEQQEELEALEEKLGATNEGEEEKKMQEIHSANTQELRERKNKLQAELAARVDLNPEEAAKIQETHEKELGKLKDKLEASKLRQEADLKEQLARRRQQKLVEAKKRQDLRKRQVGYISNLRRSCTELYNVHFVKFIRSGIDTDISWNLSN